MASSKSPILILLLLLLIMILPKTVSSISMDELESTLSVLRSRGHNLFSNAVTTSDAVFDLLSAASVTILLPTESSLFALDMTQPANFYVDTLRCHVIPRRLTARALSRLAEGAYLPTLLQARELRVTRRRGGAVALDGVEVTVEGIFYGRRVAVHGLDGIFSFRSVVIVGFGPQISPASDLFPANWSGSVSPAPERGLAPADRDLAILSPNSFRPVDAPVSDSPISESGDRVSPVSEPPEEFQISALSPYISPSFLAEPDGTVSPSPSIGDFSESPEASPEISPTSGSFSGEIAPSLQSKLSLGRMAPSVSSPEIYDPETPSPARFGDRDLETPSPAIRGRDRETPSPAIRGRDRETPSPTIRGRDRETPSPTIQDRDRKTPSKKIRHRDPETPSPKIRDRDREESEDLLHSAISELLNDSKISPISRSPATSPRSHSKPEISPSPATGDRFAATTSLNLPPSPPEFLRDSLQDAAKSSPPDSHSPQISPISHSGHSPPPATTPFPEKNDLTPPPPAPFPEKHDLTSPPPPSPLAEKDELMTSLPPPSPEKEEMTSLSPQTPLTEKEELLTSPSPPSSSPENDDLMTSLPPPSPSPENDELTSPPPPSPLAEKVELTSPPPPFPENDDLMTSPPPPLTGESVPETEDLILPPAAPEFIRDLWPPETIDTSSVPPPIELFDSGAAGPIAELPAMKPPLKAETKRKEMRVEGVEMMAPEQSWPSTGDTVECLVTGGNSVSCDLTNGHDSAAAAAVLTVPELFHGDE